MIDWLILVIKEGAVSRDLENQLNAGAGLWGMVNGIMRLNRMGSAC